MLWNKTQVIEYINKGKEWQRYIVCKEESKEWRTLAQNRTWWKLLTAIWVHKYWDTEDAKKYTLIFMFWHKENKYKWRTIYIPNETSTKALSKEKAIKYLDFLIEYCKEEKVPVVITPREIQDLYNYYQ